MCTLKLGGSRVASSPRSTWRTDASNGCNRPKRLWPYGWDGKWPQRATFEPDSRLLLLQDSKVVSTSGRRSGLEVRLLVTTICAW